MTESNPHVVVIGGGYAGVLAANRLQLKRDLKITLVNPRPEFVERIRLHQLVAGTHAATQRYDDVLGAQVQLVVAAAERIDPADRRIVLSSGATMDYDYLIYAVGSTALPGAGEFAYPLSDLDRAQRLRARLAELPPSAPVVVVGAGLTGIESAAELAEPIAKSTYKDADGVVRPSPNKWQAIYILGQIHDARREPAKALAYYRQVADRFRDAAGAIQDFTRKRLELPEVTVVRPAAESKIKLDYRNVAQVDVKVYPVDLMRLYLTRRNLDGIAGIDLAGITPLHEAAVALAPGADFQDHQTSVDVPVKKEGAYLVMIRGDDLYSSGIVLVSPLEMNVMEDDPSAADEAGIRITVRDAQTKELLPKVQVKVVGSAMTQFVSGETDLRGVFTAHGVQGVVTAVARKDAGNYAFYRGVKVRHPAPLDADGAPARRGQGRPQTLDDNLKSQNDANTLRQIQRLQQRYQQHEGGKAKGAAAGEFR